LDKNRNTENVLNDIPVALCRLEEGLVELDGLKPWQKMIIAPSLVRNMYIYVYVCLNVWVYIYVYIYMFIYAHINRSVYVNEFMNTYLDADTYIHMCIYLKK
jgi:hypothetical protein